MKLATLGLGTTGLLALALLGAGCGSDGSAPDQTNAELRGGHKADAQVALPDASHKPKSEDADEDEDSDESADSGADVDEDSDAAADEDHEVDEAAERDAGAKPAHGGDSGKDHAKPAK
jgi:hypothetical protein